MRTPKPLIRGEATVYFKPDNKIKEVINLIDYLIAGKRFETLDSGEQIYLLNCQSKLKEMKNGHFTESNLAFLEKTINSLWLTLTEAKHSLNLIAKTKGE